MQISLTFGGEFLHFLCSPKKSLSFVKRLLKPFPQDKSRANDFGTIFHICISLVLDSLNSAYFVELEVVGNEVTARFFNETRTELITELSATDANPLGSGFIGLGVGNSDADPDLLNNLSATFDNFGAQHVPEPSTLLALLGFGTLAGKTLRRK